MKQLARVLVAACATAFVPRAILLAQGGDAARWAKEAAAVTITRDDWGIAHVHGKTDADAIFGMIYAQAEDDFNRVETNYINSMGRLAEAEGVSRIWQDLRMKLFINPDSLKVEYAASPKWLQTDMNAWADGLNYYLAKHPAVTPRVIKHFEPWMALSFTEGSIGGDIESNITPNQLQAFYGTQPNGAAPGGADPALNPLPAPDDDPSMDPGGSNGMAISPANTVAHHALLLINPHTSFYFRSELQMSSDDGLDAYGAVTWGQFFIYQGFNAHAGWMHTSSGVNAVSKYLETIVKKGDRYYYKYGAEERPFATAQVALPYKTDKGMAERTVTVYYSQHGPVIAESNGKWETVDLMKEHVKALTQSYTRTKAKDYKEFRQIMELHTNSSNNTIFADAEGNIAYFHGNFIPRRDPKFDWNRPVDGSDPATDWHGLLSVDSTPHLLNPASGWLYNSNNWPWSAAGPSSPKKEDYPAYVEKGGESARGLHAIRVLQNKKDFTLDGLIAAAFDSYQTWFEKPIPALIKAWDDAPASDPLKANLADQIALLRTWDLRWSATSVPTTLAIYWAEDVQRRAGRGGGVAGGASAADPLGNRVSADQMLQSLSTASDRLTTDFGTWKTPWGDVNRFQRLNDDINATFSDAGPSIPVEFTTATWGSLASFATRESGTKKRYGISGNSFVAVVEFGDSVRAKAVTAGGEGGDPASPHFNDQAKRYANGDLRDVYFYPSQLAKHTERVYHPGA
ncbi:MAG TPA: penicillin acylase family protein [Gemmatimonadaceae bacterium]|nr:penicillin acylase family protein [Gemmatimonadaceae bacterium]